MNQVVGLGAKINSYLIDGGSEDEKAKKHKKVCQKKDLNLKIIKNIQKQLNLRIK